MRISTQHLFENGGASIGELQSGMLKTQQQIASGRRILTPSDDPIASARALEVTQSQSLNTQYATNRMYAKNSLVELDGVLEGVTELLQNVKSTVISADNGVFGDNERNIIATELKSRLDQLLGLANSRDAQGNYLFSGFQTTTPAFVKTATGATYQGDAGQRLLQVDASRQLAVSATGQSVFQGGGQDMFQTLTDVITLLQTPVVTAADRTALQTGLVSANNDLKLALDNVSTVRAAAGSRLQEIDALDTAGDDRGLQYSAILSELQDLDYTEALTRLSQQQFTFEAAQKSFVKTSGLSLFNFI